MLTNSQTWLKRAQMEKFSLGAFNANTVEQIQAIVDAAQDEKAPVVVQISHRALRFAGEGDTLRGLRLMAAAGRVAAEAVNVPVVLHLDHGNEAEAYMAAGLGFTSVMFASDDLPFEEYALRTRRLVEVLRPAGVAVEAEVGEVGRQGSPASLSRQSEASTFTDPDQAAAFVAETGVDALAVSIGSLHAVRRKEIDLNLELLARIRQQVGLPLVLHGSSGVTDASLRAGIELGLCKVNFATQLNQAFSGAIRVCLSELSEIVDPRLYLGPARAAMAEVVRERMRFLGVSGKIG